MAKITNTMNDHMRRHPLALDYELEKDYYKRVERTPRKKNQVILLCTYRCCGFHYYKYTIDGTNIFFINLLSVVIFAILDYYFLKETMHWDSWITESNFIFCLSLFSIIPLAYFIGQAVASISAQSSMGVGAVINAFSQQLWKSFVLCCPQPSKGKISRRVHDWVNFGCSVVVARVVNVRGCIQTENSEIQPEICWCLLNNVTVCHGGDVCPIDLLPNVRKLRNEMQRLHIPGVCGRCRFIQPTFVLDSLYSTVIKPFSLIVTVALFAAYVCGLFFTLRTHASLIWATTSHEPKRDDYFRSNSVVSMSTPTQTPKPTTPLPAKPGEDQGGGHDAPNWSRSKSTIILLGATILYAIIAEILVDNVDSILADFPINPKFLGLTVLHWFQIPQSSLMPYRLPSAAMSPCR